MALRLHDEDKQQTSGPSGSDLFLSETTNTGTASGASSSSSSVGSKGSSNQRAPVARAVAEKRLVFGLTNTAAPMPNAQIGKVLSVISEESEESSQDSSCEEAGGERQENDGKNDTWWSKSFLIKLQTTPMPILLILLWTLALSYLTFCVIYVSSVLPFLRQKGVHSSRAGNDVDGAEETASDTTVVEFLGPFLFEIAVSWFYFSFATPFANMWFGRLSQLFFNRAEQEFQSSDSWMMTLQRIYILANVGFDVVKFFFGRGLLLGTTSSASLFLFIIKDSFYDIWHFGFVYSDVTLLANRMRWRDSGDLDELVERGCGAILLSFEAHICVIQAEEKYASGLFLKLKQSWGYGVAVML